MSVCQQHKTNSIGTWACTSIFTFILKFSLSHSINDHLIGQAWKARFVSSLVVRSPVPAALSWIQHGAVPPSGWSPSPPPALPGNVQWNKPNSRIEKRCPPSLGPLPAGKLEWYEIHDCLICFGLKYILISPVNKNSHITWKYAASVNCSSDFKRKEPKFCYN